MRLACHAVFAWAVGDPGHPAAIWRFRLEPMDCGTEVSEGGRASVTGPGPECRRDGGPGRCGQLMVARRGKQCGVEVWPHRFRHHFSHTWLDRGGAEGDLMELNGWSSPQMLQRYGGSARGARARRHYDLVMTD